MGLARSALPRLPEQRRAVGRRSLNFGMNPVSATGYRPSLRRNRFDRPIHLGRIT